MTNSTILEIDLTRSIEELEGCRWGDAHFKSHVAMASHALRTKPLGSLTLKEIRLALSQQIGLKFVAPLALRALAADPTLETEYYEGDMLRSLLLVPHEFWRENPDMSAQAEIIVEGFQRVRPTLGAFWENNIWPRIDEAYKRFAGVLPSLKWLRPDQGRAPPPGYVE